MYRVGILWCVWDIVDKAQSSAVYRCDKGGENGVTRLASVRCPGGLAFDIDRQTCDWKTHVKNCKELESKFRRMGEVIMRRATLPLWTQSSVAIRWTR